jgi:hypothetical protein
MFQICVVIFVMEQGALGSVQESHRARPQILALGGCTIENVMNFLNDHVDFKFYVRQNLVCDMSPPLDVSSFSLDVEEAWRVMDKYAVRFHYQKLTSGDFDTLILECAADHILNYMKIGDSVIPDVRNDTLTQGWGSLSFDHIPILRDAEIISPYSPEYWENWKRDFFRLYNETLVPYIRDGKKIIFIRRYLCEKYINEHGISQFDDASIDARNEDLRKIYAYLDYFRGIDFIDPPRNFLCSSDHALTGGPWEYHPELEFYHYTAEEILRICVGSEAADAFRMEMRGQLLQERALAVTLAAARERQLAEVNEQLVAATADLAAARSHSDLLAGQKEAMSAEMKISSMQHYSQVSKLQAERTFIKVQLADMKARMAEMRDQNEAQCTALTTHRDQLADRIAMLETRYAPIRNAYKFLRLGKIRRAIRRWRSR